MQRIAKGQRDTYIDKELQIEGKEKQMREMQIVERWLEFKTY